jgi:hypothetical protein
MNAWQCLYSWFAGAKCMRNTGVLQFNTTAFMALTYGRETTFDGRDYEEIMESILIFCIPKWREFETQRS